MPHRSTLPIFKANGVFLSRTSSEADPNQELEEVANPKLILNTPQNKTLLAFLRHHAVFLSDENEKVHTSDVRLFPFSSSLNQYVQSLFETETDKVAVKVLSWVELPKAYRIDLKDDKPHSFDFLLRRAVVYRTVHRNRADGGSQQRFRIRDRMTIKFTHRFTGTSQLPVLNIVCDRASFEQNPLSRLVEPPSHSKTSHLRFLLEFLLFPLKELEHFVSGVAEAYSIGPHQKPLVENIVKPAKLKSFSLFSHKDLKLDASLNCRYFDRLKFDSFSISFQPKLTEDATSFHLAALKSSGGSASIEATQKALKDTFSRFIAKQYATFSSRIFYGADSAGFSGSIKVDPFFKKITSLGFRDEDIELSQDRLASADGQRIDKVKLTLNRERKGRPNDCEFTITLQSLDSKQFDSQVKYGEYEELRAKHLLLTGNSSESTEQQSLSLDLSMRISVTVHRRIMENDYKVRSVSDLRKYILQHYNGDPTPLYQELLEKALTNSGLYYWNLTDTWAPLVLSNDVTFLSKIEEFATRKSAVHFEAISKESWLFMEKIPRLIAEDDHYVQDDLKALFKEVSESKDKHYNKVKRVARVPEIAVALLTYWYFHPSENIKNFFESAPVVPVKWRRCYTVQQPKGSPQVKAINRLAREAKKFILDNFFVDVTRPRGLHTEVLRKQHEVLFGKRSSMSEVDSKVLSMDLKRNNVQSIENLSSYPNILIASIKTGEVFEEVTAH